MLSFKHSGSLGDIIYSLPTILSLSNTYKKPSNFYININQNSKNYLNSNHPLKNQTIANSNFNLLKPLLQQQNYINQTEIFANQEIQVDLDEFRTLGINYHHGHIPRWYFYLFKVNYDLSKPWLNVERSKKFKILVNRTSRYRNININYQFLNDYSDITFIGLEEEYDNFKREVPKSKFYKVEDFLELAEIIAGCELFIGNQSFCFSLAEAVKCPRVLETCPIVNNVIPHGENSYDCINQNAFEYIISQTF